MMMNRRPERILLLLATLCCLAASLQTSAKPVPEKFYGSESQRLWPRLARDAPALAAVDASLGNNDSAGAMRALSAYFRTRFPKDKIEIKMGKGMAQTADAALELRFRSRSSDEYFLLHKDFEWDRPPGGVKDHHWLSLLASLGDLEILADMYIRTGDEKYARGCAALFDDWATHCPPGSGSPSWSLATTMIREGIFLRVFERMVQWQDWPVEQEARLLNFIALQADLMATKRGPGNQDATNSEHLLRAARAFPEFRNAAVWSKVGSERLNDKIFQDTLPDGSSIEMCSGYHKDAAATYTQVLHELQLAGRPVAPAFTERLEKMYEWLLKMARPDGVTPTNGDSAGGNIRDFLQKGAELFHRPDMAYVASKGKEGIPPAFTDAALPVGGYYTLRSGWTSPDDLYLFMDISRQPVVSHQYFDALHLFLYAFGRDFFPATGTFTYGGESSETAKATRSANTVTIDDRNQGDVPAICNAFSTSAGLSYLDGSQQGYPGITHRRQVLFVRPAPGVMPYFLVIDRVSGSGSHRVDQYFHFPPGELEIEAAAARVHTIFPTGGNIIVSNLLNEKLNTLLIPDEMHARQGVTENRPTIRFRYNGELPTAFVTLLLPYQGTALPSYNASIIPAAVGKKLFREDGAINVQVKYGETSDMLFAAPDPISIAGEATPKRAGLIRSTPQGQQRYSF